MSTSPRKLAFVLAASDQGTMIVSRLDYGGGDQPSHGVGFQVLERGSYDPTEIEQVLFFIGRRRAHFGDGVVALDCGANIGVHTLQWAKQMTAWGSVLAFEAQERIFYALAGNIALNNCMNVRAFHAAVGSATGRLRIPVPDYLRPANLGGLELRLTPRTEQIGQPIDYSESATVEINVIAVDALSLKRLDVLKVDVEGMEAEVLDGAAWTLASLRPIVVAEHIKVGWDALAARLSPLGYRLFRTPMNMVAVHESDPTVSEIVQA